MVYVLAVLALVNGWMAFWVPSSPAVAVSGLWRFGRFFNGFAAGFCTSAVIAGLLG